MKPLALSRAIMLDTHAPWSRGKSKVKNLGSGEPPGSARMDKALNLREMFAAIAPRYDATNKILTAGADEAWRKRAVAELAPPHGGRVLDLCCGTGDLAFHLARTDPSLEVTGADFCAPML